MLHERKPTRILADPEKRLTPIKAIRAKCLDCSGGNNAEVRNCVIPSCPLYPYRMGHNPYIKMSEEKNRKWQRISHGNRKSVVKTTRNTIKRYKHPSNILIKKAPSTSRKETKQDPC